MAPDHADLLAQADRAVLVGPAGTGKTATLARAVALSAKPQLILTHTHAGIHALRRHLQAEDLDPQDFRVDTIAGFALGLATAYPCTAGWGAAVDEPAWDDLAVSATQVLQRPQLLNMVARSYRGLFVDEYQDCTLDQHNLILALAEAMPVRVLGDPLQALFGFGQSPAVDFQSQVFSAFEELPPLATPWRWLDTNPELGDWLLEARDTLANGHALEFEGAPCVEVRSGPPQMQIIACKDVAALGGTAVIVRAYPGQAHSLARRLGGEFVSIEDVEGIDLVAWARRIDEAGGTERALETIALAEACMTEVGQVMRNARGRYEQGSLGVAQNGSRAQPSVAALNAVAVGDEVMPVGLALQRLAEIPGAVVFRPEVVRDLAEAAKHCGHPPHPTLAEAIVSVRDAGRRHGRGLATRIVGRTRLVKGLEFDHAVVMDLATHDPRETYVAITRPRSTLTILDP